MGKKTITRRRDGRIWSLRTSVDVRPIGSVCLSPRSLLHVSFDRKLEAGTRKAQAKDHTPGPLHVNLSPLFQLLITLRTLKRLENFPPISLSNKETSQFRVDRPQPNPALGANLPFFKPCTKAEQIPCLLIASITDPSMDIDETMSRVRLLYVV